ncbi:PoNi-like cognate immunity protein [Herbaspirillum sp. RV1423]|uniref:PoNi-like cognate immunity protein n=1 Tax=Herbaspirillum sp. RV1423 TaxID=1443993 RepID=UPI0009DF392D|nr:PoNi-like cognate immunity protein [Herbaspirillum sp. RV1423]
MIRAPFCDEKYWDKWISFLEEEIASQTETLKHPSANPKYRPQYAFTLVKHYLHLILSKYSRGDSVAELGKHFSPLLAAWEDAKRLHLEILSVDQYHHKFDWTRNIDHYIVCFWLTGLALSLELAEDQWQRLVALMGNEGKDQLLDRVIATRQAERQVGSDLCHPKPYQHLLNVIVSSTENQRNLLKDFVEAWYSELNRPPKNKKLSEDTAIYDRPYWYKYGETNMAGGAYFGQWCIEAVAVVKAFGIDDDLCLGHPQYPGDLLRPAQVTPPDNTRLPKALLKWGTQLNDLAPAMPDSHDEVVAQANPSANWLRRLFR